MNLKILFLLCILRGTKKAWNLGSDCRLCAYDGIAEETPLINCGGAVNSSPYGFREASKAPKHQASACGTLTQQSWVVGMHLPQVAEQSEQPP